MLRKLESFYVKHFSLIADRRISFASEYSDNPKR